MWKLVIEDDEGKRTVVPLSRDDYTIGRQEGNTIRLTERNVSRAHGRVRRANGSFVLEDLRSYNGIFVNGLRVAHTQDLQHGDLIQIGDYRIVLEDDTAAQFDTTPIPITTTDPSDTKATIPLAPGYRGQTLTERPNRLVMLVGPTPGVEYPLDRERMTVGRAEDSTISVNHNSVSRLHCEIHALGDGRFEIVDKGSSNGVRVNAVELRRSIIEAGDVIELGDVRFKFVGAGQVFVAGPNESQQLTAISDREAEFEASESRAGSYIVPLVGAAVFSAVIVLALLYWSRHRSDTDREAVTPQTNTTETLIAEAKSRCTVDDCDQPHAVIAPLADSVPWRDNVDIHFITTTWAESLLRKARASTDATSRKALLTRVLADTKVEEVQRKQATDLLALDTGPTATTADLPTVANAADAGGTVVATAIPSSRPTPTSQTTVTKATTTTTAAPTPKVSTPPPSASVTKSLFESASEAALQGDAPLVRKLLERRIRGCHGTPNEARLLLNACKYPPKDPACIADVNRCFPDVD